jgi:hypothetical protein
MAKGSRPVHGPRSIGSVVPVVARKVFRHASPGVAQLLEAWTEIVGPALANATTPRRLGQGTLTIGCSGPVAMELQHLSPELIGRINQYLGSQVVKRLRLLQIAAIHQIAAIQTQGRPRSVPGALEKAASEAVASLPDGPLRTALTALGHAVLTESASRLGNQTRTRS